MALQHTLVEWRLIRYHVCFDRMACNLLTFSNRVFTLALVCFLYVVLGQSIAVSKYFLDIVSPLHHRLVHHHDLFALSCYFLKSFTSHSSLAFCCFWFVCVCVRVLVGSDSILGFSALLLESELTVDQRDFLTTIVKSGENLLTVINDILLFSKLEAGEMEFEVIDYCPLSCIEETLAIFALSASQKQIDLIAHAIPGTRRFVMGDVLRIRQCLTNLVANSIKFCGPGAEIVVAVQEGNDEQSALEFSVRDTGIGIPATKMDRLFKAFSQVDASDTRKYGNTSHRTPTPLNVCLR